MEIICHQPQNTDQEGQYLGIDIAIKEIHMSNQYDVSRPLLRS